MQAKNIFKMIARFLQKLSLNIYETEYFSFYAILMSYPKYEIANILIIGNLILIERNQLARPIAYIPMVFVSKQ